MFYKIYFKMAKYLKSKAYIKFKILKIKKFNSKLRKYFLR